MAHLLLAEGRAADVARMVRPLLRSGAAPPDEALLRSLLARAELLGHTDAAAAGALLDPWAELAARTALPPETRAEVALWRGWTLLVEEEAARALPLLHEAAAGFGPAGSVRGRLWSRLGLAEAHAGLGEEALACRALAKVRPLQQALRDVQAAARLTPLQQALPEAAAALLGAETGASASHAGRALQEALADAAASRRPVLFTGERGAGKHHAARRLHTARSGGAPFVVLDAGAVEHARLERRLSDSGALLDEAAGGTLCVREVGALPLVAQQALASLLRANAARPGAGAVCVVATTRERLDESVSRGAFRQDLYEALAGLPVHVPPLRTRRADIAPLVRYFLDALRPANAPRVALTATARQALVRYDWPGNVRQLRNEVERVLVFVGAEPAPTVDARHLSGAVIAPEPHTSSAPALPDPAQILRPGHGLDDLLAGAEKTLIEHVLAAREGHVTASAEVLGLTRQGLYKKMKRLGIDAASFQPAAVPAS